MEKEQTKALVKAVTGSDVVSREKLIEVGKKIWEFRKFLANNPELKHSDLNSEQKKFVEILRTTMGIQIPIGTGGLAGIFGENRLEYALGSSLTSHACLAFMLARYDEGLDQIFEESMRFRYVDSINERAVVRAYVKIGKKKKAKLVIERMLKTGAIWALHRAFQDYLDEIGDLKSALKVLKKIEKREENPGTIMINYRVLFDKGLKTEEVKKKMLEYAKKTLKTGRGLIQDQAIDIIEQYERKKLPDK